MSEVLCPAGLGSWKFWCPGCDVTHVISQAWKVDLETVTVTPSILVHPSKGFRDDELVGDALLSPDNVIDLPRCHSFVTNGQIQFLDDSTHPLRGQTVNLEPWESRIEGRDE